MARRGSAGALLFVIIIILVLGGGAGFFLYNNRAVTDGPITTAADITITVEPGSGSAIISRQLYEAGLTQNEAAFRRYSSQAGIDARLQAGVYTFAAGEWTLERIGERLVAGGISVSEDYFSVTIPEGLTVSQIARIFDARGLIDYDDFIYTANYGEFAFDFIPAVGSVIAPANRLEGYLAPDTYMVSRDWSAHEIITMLLRQSDRIWTADFQAQADYLGMTRNEILSLAAIIEKEAVWASERPLISGVFHNRLNTNHLLQSCATVQFLLPEPQVPLLYVSLRIESPFNTYIHLGLPPSPIAAPGRASIEAALWPEETNYFFFRARHDGSHRFSVTFAEHNTRQPDDQ